MIPGSANPLLLASAAAAGGYAIERSVRFNSSDSAYLSRAASDFSGTPTTFTFSGWVKRSAIDDTRHAIAGTRGSPYPTSYLFFDGVDGNTFEFVSAAGVSSLQLVLKSSSLYRDPSAWYHVLLSVTSGGTGYLYVNGVEVASAPAAANTALFRDAAGNDNHIGSFGGSGGYFLNGYLADIHFIDGQALDPTSFGEFDNNGIWQPIAYSGSYGTNGFHLDFSDNSTAAALGTDTSPNGNTWTVNNISVAAGAGNDSVVDVPTNGTETDTGVGGEVRGNYATLNPLSKGSAVTLSDGNLQHYSTDSSWSGPSVALCGFGMTAGKWYWECTISTHQYSYIGIAQIDKTHSYIGGNSNSCGYLTSHGSFVGGGAQTASPTVVYTPNATLMFAYDADAKKFWVGQNGTWFSVGGNAGDPANGNYPSHSGFGSNGEVYTAATSTYSTVTTKFNFGQRPFAYTAPSGFKALCTANLPAPVVTKPSTVMDVKLYTGNGTTQNITGLGFNPDLVWMKVRNYIYWNELVDSVRGVGKSLFSNAADAEGTINTLTAFNADGFTVSTNSGTYNGTNENGRPYVAWTWDAGSSTVTNTDGSITSSVRANPSAGFSIVTWTPQATAGTVGHGLGVAPAMIITKDRDTANGWFTYHSALGATKYLVLNLTNAVTTNSTVFSTAPTSTVFDQGTGFTSTNGYGRQVCYCFAPVAGYSSISSFVGNNSTDGTFVYTGHRVRWLLIKNTTTSGTSWAIFDSARSTYNVVDNVLLAHSSGAELTGTFVDFLSNGFKLRVSSNPSLNNNGDTYIYAAFAESPFQYARAR